jgi:SAM-dependent methyltransferase
MSDMIPRHHPLDEERLRRRASFNADASRYDAARPDYPAALFDDLIALAGVSAGATVLEIGSGTGKATLPLAQRGFSILGIELGEQMAALARQKLAAYPQVRIEVGAFEDWPLPETPFDLAVSASAWHWIDPTIGYQKVAQALKPTGTLALMWSSQRHENTDARRDAEYGGASNTQDEPDAFTRALREVVRSTAPELGHFRADRPDSGARRFVRADALEASGYFRVPAVRTYAWETTYDTASYLRLLDSYSSYRILEPGLHERLFETIGDLLETRFGGSVTRPWRAELYLAKLR